ncbi:mitochondrial ATP synthase g subunit-domain-containing protein [Daldinia caldariorum]|uniref:mitochondrial ATP synthase g subunit-domain-containing protein n=1 Tax=Daldinia caldariorum TaxID=326644 RepID=UPI0020076BB2|nr:mitochondrial ATP synthase g subunit-domain-containing protein [Daldinia caldariorum]KAI1465501.1 mitochondrial ATP synthase g subunit-domain-containing protein [Daldinia caldariorum]
MSSALARPLLRQSGAWGRMTARRFESTTASKASEAAKETASKAKETASKAAANASETASQYATKAAQGLSRVTSSAGPAISGAAKGIANSLGKVGGRTGRLVAFFERTTPTVIYYSKVGAELAKMVFRGQKMSPPSLTTVQSYWQNLLNSAKNPSALLQTASKVVDQPATIVQRARNINRAQLVNGGVVLAECIGFFTIGEMIGRFKLIGYHGGAQAEHH